MLVGSTRLTPSILFLTAANLIPLIGVFLFGWTVLDILLLYWVENVIIGVLNIPKMWMCQGNPFGKVFNSVFFSFHFGMFCFGHGAIIADIFGDGADLKTLVLKTAILWTAASFLLSHAFSFLLNFIGKGEYKTRDMQTQMFLPYGRIVLMHIVVLVGGLLVQELGSPIYALLVLIGLKTAMDIGAHRLEHKDPETIEMKD